MDSASKLNHILQLAAKGFVALVPALAIIVGTAWAISVPGLELYLQATVWTSGFVFFGLALDSQKAAVGLALASGFAMLGLAWLSERAGSEFTIVAAALVAAWVAAAILRR
jgi:hypothetical protein